jgi:predicted PurR-regulated permease PerM
MEEIRETELRRPSWVVVLAFLGALAVASGLVLRILASFFAVLLLGLVAACLIYPGYLRMVALFRGHRRVAALAVCVALMAAVLAPILVTVQALSQEALSFYEMITVQVSQRSMLEILEQRKEELDRLNRFISPFGINLTPRDLYQSVGSLGVQLGAFFYKQGVALAKGLVRLVFGFCFWLLILFYLLVDGERLKKWFLETLPMPAQQQRLIIHRFTDMSSSLVVGNGLAGVIQGTAGGLIFALLGLPGPVLWGVVMAILAFIPVIGISLVFVPTTIVLLLVGDGMRALLVFFPLLVISAFVEYWLKPTLVGRRAQVHTLLVFLSLLGGLEFMGPIGLLIGPLIMTAFISLLGIYRDHYRPLIHLSSSDSQPGES